jgi:hypothetical protein
MRITTRKFKNLILKCAKDLKRHSQIGHTNINQCIKRYTYFLSSGKYKSEPPQNIYKMSKIKKTKRNICWKECED